MHDEKIWTTGGRHMNRAILSSIGALISLMAAHAFASNWQVVSEDRTQRTTIDRESATRTGDLVSLWSKTEYLDYSAQPVIKNQKIARVVTKWRIKCTARQVSAGPSMFYSRGGTAIAPISDLPLDFEEIVPDSSADVARQVMCR